MRNRTLARRNNEQGRGTAGGEGSSLLLRADGYTVDAAPLTSPYIARIGSLAVVQDDGEIGADGAGFRVTAQGSPDWEDLSLSGSVGFTRAAGMATYGRIVADDVTTLLQAGWWNVAAIEETGAQGIYTAFSLLKVTETDGTIINTSIPIVDGDIIDYVVIARATGSHIIASINGGAFQRIWTFTTDSTATIYAAQAFYDAAPFVGTLRAKQLSHSLIPVPLVSDNFSDSSAPFVTDGEAHLEADGDGAGFVWSGATWSNASNQSLNGATGGAELLADGDMEAAGVDDWTAGNSATLTKETGTPHGGTRVLRVARNGVNNPSANQPVVTAGIWHKMAGFTRSDGNAFSILFGNGGLATIWTGTTSTSWQASDVVFLAKGNAVFMQVITSTGTEYCEWDDYSIVPIPIADMLRLVDTGSAHHEVWLDLTITGGAPGGACVACDDKDTPQNFVTVYFDRVNNTVRADKYIAGVLDTAGIINVSKTYNAQAPIYVSWSDDDGDGTYDLRVFYDFELAGATTVSDVEIVGGTCAGEFGLTDGGFGEDFIAWPILFGIQYNHLFTGSGPITPFRAHSAGFSSGFS